MTRSLTTIVLLLLLALSVGVIGASGQRAGGPQAVVDDPLLRMPGTQPEHNVDLADPGQCTNCHADYDPAAEPYDNWQGSMMAQSMRDILFWPTLAVAAQDATTYLGSTNATDLCLRCHSPAGWLRGNSDPTNGSLMAGPDHDGVQCTVCHYMYDPFFETTYDGTREGSDWAGYWDETDASDTPSSAAAAVTYAADATEAAGVLLFNGDPFFNANLPPAGYTENGSGQYFIATDLNDRRASFADANANHGMLYSRYHKSKFFCAACHDVSNPALHNLGADPLQPLPSETDSAYSYYHVERTFSEFMLSDFGAPGGATGTGAFAPDVFTTSRPGNAIATCQDCHMRDVTGKGADKNQAVLRPTESIEHPQSGVPQHDLTGGNVWVPTILASTQTGSPNYDPVNAALLGQGPGVLTLDLNAGQGIDADHLLAGAARAESMLLSAARIEGIHYHPGTGELTFTVINDTGHKLISGFPEGRRMFVNVRYYDYQDELMFEVNPYDAAAATLKGLPYSYSDPDGSVPAPAPLTPIETHVDGLVYEMKPSSSLTGETTTFHFLLGTDRYKDNRIPPQGFRIDEAGARLSEPVWEGSVDTAYYSAAEYAAGSDQVALAADYGVAVQNAVRIEIGLYYQVTSREYIEFLRDEIDTTTTDPFYSALKAWGPTIWDVWTHNRDLPGAAPVEMVEAEWEGVPTGVTLSHEQVTVAATSPIATAILGAALLIVSLTVAWRRR